MSKREVEEKEEDEVEAFACRRFPETFPVLGPTRG